MTFWSLIGRPLVHCINYSYEFGELSNSQKQAIINLIEKKGRDKRLIKNWQPITIINVDAKIISKILAKSLGKVLPNLIPPNEKVFVKGRSIFDAIRMIDNIVDYTKRNSWSGILIAIDFEKAFDTLDFQFLIRTLHKFNFGPSFIHWIRTLYKSASSCVLNNGFRGIHSRGAASPKISAQEPVAHQRIWK